MENKPLGTIPNNDITINDKYWNRYTRLITETVIPYQWEVLHDRIADAVPSHCIENFRIAAEEAAGEWGGEVFQDSDLYKWLEAVAYSLGTNPDAELENKADEMIALIGRAQQSDGYINTYYTLVEPNGRWSNLTQGHELYCAGHLFEAAAAYYQTTGKREIIEISRKFADLIANTFGPKEHQHKGLPGHPEIELALVRLYQAVGDEKYLRLAKYFIDARGVGENYFLKEMSQPGFKHIFPGFENLDAKYLQSHAPVREQKTAEGHAVRAVYLYCAMADIAGLYGDDELLRACKTLWENITQKRMYITGGIGASGHLERFTADYDLPNGSGYAETCASIGLSQFGIRMARITRNASYITVVERALYNNVRAGISMEGNRFFYVNPLEVWPNNCLPNTSMAHVKPARQKWFNVACCPPNIARTFAALGQFIYYCAAEKELFINLFIGNEASVVLDGKKVKVSLVTDYPRTGRTRITVNADNAGFTLYIRVPEFARDFSVFENDNRIENASIKNGYLSISKTWQESILDIDFAIKPQIVYANPLVRSNAGKVCLLRGPEVYCLEEADNGDNLAAVYISPDKGWAEDWREELLGGTMLLRGKGKKLAIPELTDSISYNQKPVFHSVNLIAVPYGSWSNRKEGEMIVWVKMEK